MKKEILWRISRAKNSRKPAPDFVCLFVFCEPQDLYFFFKILCIQVETASQIISYGKGYISVFQPKNCNRGAKNQVMLSYSIVTLLERICKRQIHQENME